MTNVVENHAENRYSSNSLKYLKNSKRPLKEIDTIECGTTSTSISVSAEETETETESENILSSIIDDPTSCSSESVNLQHWAEQAIEQNKEEWERIERMFYGEESGSSKDVRLQNEIKQWNKRFPHLRIVGQSTSLNYSPTIIPNNLPFDEIIVIHPDVETQQKPSCSPSSSHHADQPELLSITNINKLSSNCFFMKETDLCINNNITNQTNRYSSKSNTNNIDYQDNLINCLRITSGSFLSVRDNQTSSNKEHLQISDRIVSVKSDSKINDKSDSKINDNSDYPNTSLLMPINNRQSELLTLSARSIKMPPISMYNYGKDMTGNQQHNRRQLQNSITLPSINRQHQSPFDAEIIGRSISAVHKNKSRYQMKL